MATPSKSAKPELRRLTQLLRAEDGATATEYAVMASLLVAASVWSIETMHAAARDTVVLASAVIGGTDGQGGTPAAVEGGAPSGALASLHALPQEGGIPTSGINLTSGISLTSDLPLSSPEEDSGKGNGKDKGNGNGNGNKNGHGKDD